MSALGRLRPLSNPATRRRLLSVKQTLELIFQQLNSDHPLLRQSGNSISYFNVAMTGSFRPRPCKNVPDLDDAGTAHHIGNAFAEINTLSPTLVLFRS